MLERLLVCVNHRQATAGIWRMGKLVAATAFANEVYGHEAFKTWLSQHKKLGIRWIVDTAEEDLRLETLPHVRGGTRQAMLERKLNQYYRDLDFRIAQYVSRENTGRRDDRFLFMALTKTHSLTPWMEAAAELQMPLAGVYLMSAISLLLAKTLRLNQSNLLLATQNSAGLRQSHYADNALRLSRLIPNTGNQQYVSETEKTLLYLLNAQLSALPSQLHLVFIGLEGSEVEMVKPLEKHSETSLTTISIPELALRLGLEAESLQHYPDLMHMHLLARHGSTANLAKNELLKPLRMRHVGLSLNIASGTILASAALSSAVNTAATLHNQDEARELAAQTSQLEQQYGQVAQTFPTSPHPGSHLKTTVELAARLDHLNRTPQRMMQIVGVVLDQHQEIQLKRLHWQMTDQVDEKEPSNSSLANMRETALIEGEIAHFNGDYGMALQQVAQLAASLKFSTQVKQVDILQQPINTSSLESLQGSTLEQHAQHASAAFKLRVILKEPS